MEQDLNHTETVRSAGLEGTIVASAPFDGRRSIVPYAAEEQTFSSAKPNSLDRLVSAVAQRSDRLFCGSDSPK